jgi:hypothetical protein
MNVGRRGMISRTAKLAAEPDTQLSAELSSAAHFVVGLFESVQYRLNASEIFGAGPIIG